MADNLRSVEYGPPSGVLINAAFNMRHKPAKGPAAPAGDEQTEAPKFDAAVAKKPEGIAHGKQ